MHLFLWLLLCVVDEEKMLADIREKLKIRDDQTDQILTEIGWTKEVIHHINTNTNINIDKHSIQNVCGTWIIICILYIYRKETV